MLYHLYSFRYAFNYLTTEISDLCVYENANWTTLCSQSKINFNWSAFFHNGYHCDHHDVISFDILASNCGSCPTTTNHTNATCTDIPTDGSICTFSVRSNICNYSEWQKITMIPNCSGTHHIIIKITIYIDIHIGENDPEILLLVLIPSLIMFLSLVAILIPLSLRIFKRRSFSNLQ